MVPADPAHGSPAWRGRGGGLRPTKPFSGDDEAGLKQESALMALDQTTGRDHAGNHPQLDLPRISQELSARHPKAPVWRLAPREPRILPLLQFCQIRQTVYRQLLCIALASRREAFNISAYFLP